MNTEFEKLGFKLEAVTEDGTAFYSHPAFGPYPQNKYVVHKGNDPLQGLVANVYYSGIERGKNEIKKELKSVIDQAKQILFLL